MPATHPFINITLRRLLVYFIFYVISVPQLSASPLPPDIQPIDADTLHFYNEQEFHDFLEYYELKHYDILPPSVSFDCMFSDTFTYYSSPLGDQTYLAEDTYADQPFTVFADHFTTKKTVVNLMPSLDDPDANLCNVNIYFKNPYTLQVAVFHDMYNWMDENGWNIFNMNKKVYFLWGFTSGSILFETDMIQDSTGYDFSFPDIIPAPGITLTFDSISTYTQVSYYADADNDGYGDAASSMLAYPWNIPPGYISDNTDCNDADANIKPGASEICNGMDDNCNSTIDDGADSVTVTPTGTVSVCRGTLVLIEANTGTGLTYQWKKNGNLISAATASSYSTNKPGNYTVEITSTAGCTVTSTPTVITNLPSPMATITNIDGTYDLCEDASIRLKANPGAGQTYQWYKDASIISGATSVNYFATAPGSYNVRVTKTASGCNKLSAATHIFSSCKEGTPPAQLAANTLLISPNPNNGTFQVVIPESFSFEKTALMQIFSVSCGIIYEREIEITVSTFMINIEDFRFIPGMYYLSLQTADSVLKSPFHVQN